MTELATRARTHVSNVLVIGSGAAGLRAAIAAHTTGAEVQIIGKRTRKDAHTVLASGGINAAFGNVDPEDRWEIHFADTLDEAYLLAQPRAVEILARESPDAVLELADWGCAFARTPEGKLDQRYFGAHRYRRTCYAGDYTGRAILHTLVDKIDELGVPIAEEQYVSSLLVRDRSCFGALAFDIQTGERTVFLADAVVLAAGGHTRLWRRSSSRRDENNGDAMALALDAGCELADMELVQFHPTGMTHPEEWAGRLVTEAVRGEGGHLKNSEGERFMERYDPERMELSTRDRVALANYTEIQEGRSGAHDGVYLDITHLGKDKILEKLPKMYRQFIEAQMLDITTKPMEVAPTAHYSMGGVVVDFDDCSTSVEGLYAVGECTAGLHGANRLGGNSLAETVVFGKRAGLAAADHALGKEAQVRARSVIDAAHDRLDERIGKGTEFARVLQRAVRDTMWGHCGVVRDEDGLRVALRRLSEVREASANVDVRPTSEGWGDLAHALDLAATLTSAEATVRGALERRETRGAHNRADHPDLDQDLRVSFLLAREGDGGLVLRSEHVPEVPEELQRWLDDDDLDVEGRLLE